MYEQVLQLPVFQGISREQLTEILERVPFTFLKYKAGDVLANVGQDFTEVIFLVSGEVQCLTPYVCDARSPQSTTVKVSQHFHASYTLPIVNLFGFNTYHTCLIRATGEVGVMTLDKPNFLKAVQSNKILLINTLNMLSSAAQKNKDAIDRFMLLDETGRLAYWILNHTHRRSYDVTISGTAETWSKLLDCDPRAYWKAVAQLEKIKAVESQEESLYLLDRYALEQFVNEKITN
jgi:hypothetical protein